MSAGAVDTTDTDTDTESALTSQSVIGVFFYPRL